ncbi:hypothetical protein [Nannocystis radixulma]|uniref:Secreted protein n=1 Tax=Nannocystis radixulma TaxID=2995305 RepID=A0ABT5BIJ4_9BACT|nr:hypothetical protein [Nannocystis radixulma]MDC0673985.1 hypothetical protein [Nannocystis radixulma]
MSSRRDIRFWGALFGVLVLVVSLASFPTTPRTASSGARVESYVDVPELHDVPVVSRERRGEPGTGKAPHLAAPPQPVAAIASLARVVSQPPPHPIERPCAPRSQRTCSARGPPH